MTKTSKMRRVVAVLASVAMIAALCLVITGCANESNTTENDSTTESPVVTDDVDTMTGDTEQTAKPAESTDDTDKATLAKANVLGLRGPTGIGMVKMMEDNSEEADSPFEFNLVSAPDEATAAIINGEADIAMVPTNLAAVLYNKLEGGVKMICVNALGNLYILSQDDGVTTMEDLRGQTIYATGQGANPQYILEHLLSQAGLEVGTDVTVEYLSEHAELATLMAAGNRELGMLPEPFVATAMAKNADLKIALNLNDVWEQQDNAGQMAMGCAIVRTEYLEEHPETVDEFLAQLKDSVQYALDDVPGTAKLCAKYQIIADEAVAEEAIPYCAITFIDGDQQQSSVEGFFEVLYNADPASVGGTIPDADFYYVQ